MKKNKSLRSLLTLCLIILASCSKDEASKVSESKFTQLYSGAFKNCFQCHAPGGSAYDQQYSGLDFSTKDKAYSGLKSLKSISLGASACADIPYVTASNPNKSYLLAMFLESYNVENFAGKSNCIPSKHHLDSENLTNAEKNLLLDWINEGASI